MRRSIFLFAFASLLLVSCTITDASAKGWAKSDKLPPVRYTATHPGSIKICGDHKCAPFENITKSLQNKLK
ncbi:MAG: hypothetical protein WA833_09155 [Nitrosotalea sp.]